MPTIEQGILVVFKSENGRDGWVPVMPDDVPEWVKDPDNMARLVDGEVCMDATQESGSDWFIALPMPEKEEIEAWLAAQAKRERKQNKALH